MFVTFHRPGSQLLGSQLRVSRDRIRSSNVQKFLTLMLAVRRTSSILFDWRIRRLRYLYRPARAMGSVSDNAHKNGQAPDDSDFANYFCTYAFLYHQVRACISFSPHSPLERYAGRPKTNRMLLRRRYEKSGSIQRQRCPGRGHWKWHTGSVCCQGRSQESLCSRGHRNGTARTDAHQSQPRRLKSPFFLWVQI